MIKLDKYTVPLFVLHSIKNLREELERIANTHNSILEIKEEDSLIFRVIFKEVKSSFYFEVVSFEQNKSDLKTYFTIRTSPYNDTSLGEYSTLLLPEQIHNRFQKWINIIISYDSIQLTIDDKIEKKYEEEFLEFFEIIDTDAEVNAFDLKQQIFLNDFIESSIEVLKNEDQSDSEIIELIDLAENFKRQLPISTKKVTSKALSKFFAKVRKKGIPLVKEIGRKFKDELIKRGLTWSMDRAASFFLDIFS